MRRRVMPVAVVAAFESCMLTMRTERSVGLRPPEKGTSSVVDYLRWRWLLLPLPLPGARGDRRSRTSLLC
jgi:hypothetical protein